MQIHELNNSEISISWEAIAEAVSYKVLIKGLGARDMQIYDTDTSETNHIQSSLVVGSYYSVFVSWKDASNNYTAVAPPFICRVGNGGTGVVIDEFECVFAYYEPITSGAISTSATINADGCILINLPDFGSTDLQYALIYELGSPYTEKKYGVHLFPITDDTKLAVSILPSSLTSPDDTIDITLYPYRG